MKIGIFGGCFNPPHKKHKAIATKLIEDGVLDKVIYVPTGNKYNKKDLADFTDRYNMLIMMCCNNSSLEVSDYECKQTLTYTYQTLDYFKSVYPNDELYFILGTDLFKEIESWRNYIYLLENYKFLILNRNDDDISELVTKYDKYKNNIISKYLPKENISSTIIRNCIKENSDTGLLNEYLEEDILSYVRENNLYK